MWLTSREQRRSSPIGNSQRGAAVLIKSLLDKLDGGERVAKEVSNVRVCDALRELRDEHNFRIVIWSGGLQGGDVHPLPDIPPAFNAKLKWYPAAIYIENEIPTMELFYQLVDRHWELVYSKWKKKQKLGIPICNLRFGWDPIRFSTKEIVTEFIGIAGVIRKGRPLPNVMLGGIKFYRFSEYGPEIFVD